MVICQRYWVVDSGIRRRIGPGVLKHTINHRDGFAPATAGWPQGKEVGGRKEEAAGELRFSKHMWVPGPLRSPTWVRGNGQDNPVCPEWPALAPPPGRGSGDFVVWFGHPYPHLMITGLL